MSLPPVLVIDADAASLRAATAALGGRADVVYAATLQGGLERLRERAWAATLLSLDLPAADLALARRIAESSTAHAGALVLVTARPTMQLTIEASRLGVVGVFGAPLEAAELAAALGGLFHPVGPVVPLRLAGAETVGGNGSADEDETAIGASPAMLHVFRMIGRVAPSPATVLVTGESGTGKELIARAIHCHSARAGGPFVAINCAAIPENLLESELFGHEKGAFTGAIARKIGRFERAHRGTLLLDEIGDMSLALQTKILRALQEKEIERVGGEGRIGVDVRVVAATNRDLRAAIEEGTFREDLYFRLAVVTLPLPRLVERGDDLELLTHHFVARYAARYARPITGIARSVLERLREHQWPGNVRELKNVLERAVLLSHGAVLLPEYLPLEQMRAGLGAPAGTGVPLAGYAATLPLVDVERLHIREVLHGVGGHLGRAAEVLGVHRNTLTRKVREYGLA